MTQNEITRERNDGERDKQELATDNKGRSQEKSLHSTYEEKRRHSFIDKLGKTKTDKHLELYIHRPISEAKSRQMTSTTASTGLPTTIYATKNLNNNECDSPMANISQRYHKTATYDTKEHEIFVKSLEEIEDKPNFFNRNAVGRRTIRVRRAYCDEIESQESAIKTSIAGAEISEKTQTNKSEAEIIDIVEKFDKKPIDIVDKTQQNLDKVVRRFSTINQDDVQQAKKNLKSPTITQELISNSAYDSQHTTLLTQNIEKRDTNFTYNFSRKIDRKKTIALKPNLVPLPANMVKPLTNHEEGFEAAKSLVSDTPLLSKESSATKPASGITTTSRLAGRLKKTSQSPHANSNTGTTLSKSMKSFNNNMRSTGNGNEVKSQRVHQRDVANVGCTGSLRRLPINRSPSSKNEQVNIETKLNDGFNSPVQSMRSYHSSINSLTSINTVHHTPLSLPSRNEAKTKRLISSSQGRTPSTNINGKVRSYQRLPSHKRKENNLSTTNLKEIKKQYTRPLNRFMQPTASSATKRNH